MWDSRRGTSWIARGTSRTRFHLAFALGSLRGRCRCIRGCLLGGLKNFRKGRIGRDPGIGDDLGHGIAKSRVFSTCLVISSKVLRDQPELVHRVEQGNKRGADPVCETSRDFPLIGNRPIEEVIDGGQGIGGRPEVFRDGVRVSTKSDIPYGLI